MQPVYVIGHKNPDTDAICSAIGYAWFLRQTGLAAAEAACCGEINARTQYVLSTAGLESPPLLMDVRPTIGHIAHRNVFTALEDETLFAVYRRMRQHHIRAFPTIDTEGRPTGILSFAHLMELVLPDHDVDVGARSVETSLTRIREVLDGSFAHTVDPTRDEELLVTVAAMSAEGFRRRLHAFPAARTLVVTGDRPTVQRPSIEYGVRAIVITGGYAPSAETLAQARERGVSLLLSPHDTATTTLLLRSAKIVKRAVTREFLRVPEGALVERIARDVAGLSQELFPVVDEAGVMTGVFSKSDLVNPRRTRLVLVDHNELAQAVTGADQADILEVIDHHRVGGGLISREPIRFINEPVGSTSTIVTRFLHQRGLVPPREIAICLTAGIVTDTLNLTSPTATATDREMLDWLATASGLNIPSFTRNVFAAGSVLELYPPAEAVAMDCKEYREGDWRFAVAQIEEVGLDHFEALKDALLQSLQQLVANRALDLACLMVTDVTHHFSLLITAGSERAIAAIDYPEREAGLFELDGIVSRKKQLLPHLARMLGGLQK
jgi:manganese-dependent inorganic pyrophosphatase